MTDIVISAITAWQTNPNGDLQIFLLGDTIFTVIAEQDSVVAHLRFHVGWVTPHTRRSYTGTNGILPYTGIKWNVIIM